MKSILKFINKTLRGGIFLIIPILLVILLLAKALGIIMPLAENINSLLFPHEDSLNIALLISISIIVLACFLAGLAAYSFIGTAIVTWIENNILSMFPAYQLMKNSYKASLDISSTKKLPVVLVPADGWVIAFLVEELENDYKLVFIPGAPNPWEGGLSIFKTEQIRETNLSQKDAVAILRKTGIDTAQIWSKGFKFSQLG